MVKTLEEKLAFLDQLMNRELITYQEWKRLTLATAYGMSLEELNEAVHSAIMTKKTCDCGAVHVNLPHYDWCSAL